MPLELRQRLEAMGDGTHRALLADGRPAFVKRRRRAPPGFFAAEASGVDPHWRERAPVYNLYHLLNHLSLFGGGYAQAVADVLRRY